MKTRIRFILFPFSLGLLMAGIFIFESAAYSDVPLAAPLTCVAGPHSGVITGTQQWCAADGPHLLSSDVTVPSGVTLTVEANVIVQGASNVELLVEGRLEALGTPTQPITFTSAADSGPSEWSGLFFDGGTGHLRHTTTRYSGHTNSNSTRSNITVRNVLTGEVRIEDSQVRDSYDTGYYDYGLYIDNSQVSVSNTLFTGNGDWSQDAVLYIIGANSVVTLTDNSFVGNSRNRILLAPGAMMGHNATLTPQTGVQGYELENDFTVPPTVTLTIEPGVKIMGGGAVELKIRGHLQALGTPGQPITFTSVTDSGGGQWQGLFFDGGTGHLRHATVRYGGGLNSSGTYSNIAVQNTLAGQVYLESCQVNDSQNAFYTEYGLYINNGRATISDTLFSGNGNGGAAAPLYITGPSSVVNMADNSFTGNSRDRIVLAPGAMMGHDTTLSPQTEMQGFEFANDFTVPPTVTLTLEPGVTIMSAGPAELRVQGDLQALGTAGQPITFTSVGDSVSYQWDGLVFDGGTGHLRYAIARYGGGPNSSGSYSTIAVQNTLAGEVHLENCQVSDTQNAFYTEYGLYVNNGRATISDTLFSGNGNGGAAAPLYITGPNSAVTMTDNSFTGNLPRDRIILADAAMTSSDTPLTLQTVPYELTSDFAVPAASTLTIEPGVILKGASGVELTVQGNLQALGTTEQPITFTSVTDSGDGQWSGLVFDGGTGHLRHAMVRYGGNSNSAGARSNIAVRNTLAGEVYLESSQVRDSGDWFADYGLYVNNGQITVDDTTISGSDVNVYVIGDSTVMLDKSVIEAATSHGVDVEGDLAWLRATNSSIWSNGALSGDGIYNAGNSTVILSGDPAMGNFIAYNQNYGVNQAGLSGQIIATHNYWGDPSGPTHSGNPGGIGERVTDRVLYDQWLTAVPTATLGTASLAQAVGPRYISPGETVNLGVLFNNFLSKTLTNTVVVAHLPAEAEYLMSTGDGQYWPERHQVVWQLGDVTPGTAQHYGIQVRFEWGLPPHHHMDYAALGAAENLPNAWMTYAEYQSYTEVSVESRQPVSSVELDALLAADPDLNALYQSALLDGFIYYGGAQMEQLSDGTSRLALVMIDTTKPGERMDLYRDLNDAVIVHTTPMYEAIYNLTGGYRFYFETGSVTSWGEMRSGLLTQVAVYLPCTTDGCGYFGYNDCLRNCMINRIPPGQFAAHYSSACAACYSSGTQCQQCANNMYLLRSDTIRNDLDYCYDICDESHDNGKCTESTRHCVNSTTFVETPCVDCEYAPSQNTWGSCAAGERCINGDCYDPNDPDIDNDTIEAVVAHDPNALYGPQAVAPGQTIEYTIEWENEGAGTAYGVYVESALPPELDESTLQIGGNGVYFPGGRLIMWNVGELGPGAGGSVTFTVRVPASIISGTVFVAGATVYFPSVPETTPTNNVVSIVGDVVGHSQMVETEEETAVGISLSGYSPTGNPLSYALGQEAINGTLTGTPPNLTYTPEANFEGIDWIEFTVNDGMNSSLPAYVTIIVNTSAETTAPKVFVTSPQDGDMDVKAYANPLYDNIYAPSIWAQFTEPIDGDTLTTGTFFVEASSGQRVTGTVTYDGTSNKALFILNTSLARNHPYTVTLTGGIQDTSGNSLAVDYVWYFNTERYALFLPIIIR